MMKAVGNRHEFNVHQTADSGARVAVAGSREEVNGNVDNATVETFCSALASVDTYWQQQELPL
jgi:hypothetical protein